MDAELRVTLLDRLRFLAARPHRRTDPPGCAYCGDQVLTAGGSLCQNCLDRLDRLTLPSKENLSRTADTQPVYTNSDPKFSRRSDEKPGGRTASGLPFEDGE